LIVMGVSGSGKSTIGYKLSCRLGCKFIDGDDLHPRANIMKMASGQPLNDDDREPWLQRLNDVAYSLTQKKERGVVVCSALKQRYRDRLRRDNTGVLFIYLKGSYQVILQRLEARRAGHFMPSTLLQSQFDALEEPDPSIETDVLSIDIDHSTIDQVVDSCCQVLSTR
ncbi:hypothetical protein SAMD00019534_098290, partial [Acytostelium subglobosum LB1]|uniref:hypothetical protein n=1 Tax=Acytostelium subglobosum LB1 TaxID=1410327 RepID=UPI0006450F90